MSETDPPTIGPETDPTIGPETRGSLISSARGTVAKLGQSADDLAGQVARLRRVVVVLLAFTIALVVIAVGLEIQVTERNTDIRHIQATVAATSAIISAVTGNPQELQDSLNAQRESRASIARIEAKLDAFIATVRAAETTTTTSP